MTVNTADGTIAISKTGTYTVIVLTNIQSAGTNGQWGQLVKNNATVISTSSAYSQASSAGLQLVFNYTGDFIAGDLIDCRLSASSAGTIGVTGYSYSVTQNNSFSTIIGNNVNKINITARAGQSTSLAVGNPILFNSPDIVGAGVIYSNGVFTLPANGEYKLEGGVGLITGTEFIFQWRNITTNALIGASANIHTSVSGRSSIATASVVVGSSPVTVRLEILLNNGVTSISGGDAPTLGRGNWANITQTGNTGFADLPIANGTNFINTSVAAQGKLGNLGIGTATPTSTFQVNGSLSLPFNSTGASGMTITSAMHTVNCNNGGVAITVTLPTPVGITGRTYIVKRDAGSTGVVTIATAAGQVQLFSGTFVATATLGVLGSTSKSMRFQSDGINWHLIN
jgi:hypothetical protein